MSVITRLALVLLAGEQSVDAANIMLNKPSVQSGTSHNYSSRNANDGSKTGSSSVTTIQQNPYWQGDLQGYYTVTSISVSSGPNYGWADDLPRAFIGISVQDVSCSEEVIRCGQWPDSVLQGRTINFICSYSGPVRFVKIWREMKDNLAIAEVEVEGEPATLSRTAFDTFMSKKIITPSRSLFVDSVLDCSNKCYRTQPCLGFSYSESAATTNCLLATDVTMTTDVKWVSYSISTCFKALNCQMDD